CYKTGCRYCDNGNNCNDGYCCATNCARKCMRCDLTPGTCTLVKNAEDPDTCSSGTPSSCGPLSPANMSDPCICNSSGGGSGCRLVNGGQCPANTQCVSTFCLTDPSGHSATGKICCPFNSPVGCGPLGHSCSSPADCISGSCSEGVCCNKACSGTCDV